MTNRYFENSKAKGWWDGYRKPYEAAGYLAMSTDEVLAKLALIHSEVSEAIEVARKIRVGELQTRITALDGKPEGFGSELADVVIRCYDLAGALNIDLDAEIELKHRFNMTRPHRHGGKLA